MTNTSVKDVSSVLNSIAAAAGTGAKNNIAGGGFQTVWNNQSGKEPSASQGADARSAVKKVPGDSLKARDEHQLRTDKQSTAAESSETRELSEEDLQEVMEVLGSAAVDFMGQIADTLGVTEEELQAAMEELGMVPADVLNPQALSKLILKVSGADDLCDLVTDGELYSDYRELMQQLNEVLGETGQKLQLDEEQLGHVLQQMQEAVSAEETETTLETKVQPVAEEAVPVVEVHGNANVPREEGAKAPVEEEIVSNVDRNAVSETPEAIRSPENAGEERNAGEDRGERHQNGEQNLNLFAQNLRTEQFQPQLQQSEAVSGSGQDVSTQDIMRQIMDYMRINLKADTSNLEMQLHPASLGTLQVQVASRGGVITANFITQNEAVKSALESQMIQLRESFEEQGVKVEAIEVTVQSHAFERNLDQGRGSGNQSQEPSRRARARRIDLNNPIPADEMEEEDVLAAQMMTASGNTVDYTV